MPPPQLTYSSHPQTIEIFESATGNKVLARTSDVSRTGCYVDTLNPLTKGTRIHNL